jgi:hypothetical protein
MKILLIWGHKLRPWGYEVRVDLADDAGQIHNEVLVFPAKNEKDLPGEKIITAAVDKLMLRLQAQIASQAEEARQAPERQALEAKERFMFCVAEGLIKAEDAVLEMAKIAPKPKEEPKVELMEGVL